MHRKGSIKILIPGFSRPLRRDRREDSYGGVAAYIKDGEFQKTQ